MVILLRLKHLFPSGCHDISVRAVEWMGCSIDDEKAQTAIPERCRYIEKDSFGTGGSPCRVLRAPGSSLCIRIVSMS